MQCDRATDLMGDLVVKSVIGKSFGAFRKILREQKLDSYFRESCFGKYLDLPEDNNAHFQMKMVYDLLKPRYCQQQPEVSRNEECLINIIKGVSISAGLSWYLVDEVYIPINCGNEFHWVLAFVVLKERRIRVYDSILRRRCSKPLSEIQKLDKILPTYLDMSGFLDQKVRIDWLTIEAYRDKIANPFDVQYVDGISQQTIGSLNCGSFISAYAEYLSDALQVPNDGLDAGLLRKRYFALL
ncbi:hypothetical protein T459_30090 [Capsicum annuum]|uniref:Ubiquitin-like protease family profile domain-containing protein n=1 Tax=Capsicum annuum TaxID=4072 RepID=A0A2G2Y7C2_CAPAN|nr:hypothetical protein T459_30090 [Capsicum annuum]